MFIPTAQNTITLRYLAPPPKHTTYNDGGGGGGWHQGVELLPGDSLSDCGSRCCYTSDALYNGLSCALCLVPCSWLGSTLGSICASLKTPIIIITTCLDWTGRQGDSTITPAPPTNCVRGGIKIFNWRLVWSEWRSNQNTSCIPQVGQRENEKQGQGEQSTDWNREGIKEETLRDKVERERESPKDRRGGGGGGGGGGSQTYRQTDQLTEQNRKQKWRQKGEAGSVRKHHLHFV